MGIQKKLTKNGSSYSLILDKSLLQLLSIEPNTMLNIETDGKSIIVTPIKDENNLDGVNDPKFQKAMDETFDQYEEALSNLAK